MEVIFILLPLSLALGGVFLLAYFWAARSGQFEDLETPAVRILPDEERETDL
ncbi:MAG: cbb3-type cytochrome oxidase assembly protein CcoS [Deltaproteobacteria bacterium]|nr:cbb3-type cytochrome oxidase assembly protein CcoS [Deltaproteobacteria bacterium]